MWDAATTEPADGICVLPALPRELWTISNGDRSLIVVDHDLPSANAINLQVNPPDARDSNNTPEVCFAEESSRSRPLDQGEPGETKEDQERYPQEEEELKMCVSA